MHISRRLARTTSSTPESSGRWGTLPVATPRFARDFGRKVDRPSNGVLQDVHWSVGLFGYFPTYTLGNIYAAELAEAMRRDLPDLDAAVAAGDFEGHRPRPDRGAAARLSQRQIRRPLRAVTGLARPQWRRIEGSEERPTICPTP